MKKAVWISFDLGVRGDYENMYAWLDEQQAKECSDSLAFINYEYKKDPLAELKKSLAGSIQISKRTRVYVIQLDAATKKMKGTFLFGGRKSPPWTGYAGGVQQEDGDEA